MEKKEERKKEERRPFETGIEVVCTGIAAETPDTAIPAEVEASTYTRPLFVTVV